MDRAFVLLLVTIGTLYFGYGCRLDLPNVPECQSSRCGDPNGDVGAMGGGGSVMVGDTQLE